MKRILSIIIASILVFACIACRTEGKKEENMGTKKEETVATGIITGGWQFSEGLDKTQQAVFESAVKGLLGVTYTPLACLGTQLVAGTNYCFLCLAKTATKDAVPYYALLYVYEDLEGKTEATDIIRLDLGKSSESDTWVITAEPKEARMGGWNAADSTALTEERKKVFESAAEGLLGVGYEPELYLAKQIVSGTNHCFLCKATVVSPDAKPYYALVYVYENLAGETTITNISAASIGEKLLEK